MTPGAAEATAEAAAQPATEVSVPTETAAGLVAAAVAAADTQDIGVGVTEPSDAFTEAWIGFGYPLSRTNNSNLQTF